MKHRFPDRHRRCRWCWRPHMGRTHTAAGRLRISKSQAKSSSKRIRCSIYTLTTGSLAEEGAKQITDEQYSEHRKHFLYGCCTLLQYPTYRDATSCHHMATVILHQPMKCTCMSCHNQLAVRVQLDVINRNSLQAGTKINLISSPSSSSGRSFKGFPWYLVQRNSLGHRDLNLWPLTTKMWSVHCWVQVDIWVKSEGIPVRQSWRIYVLEVTLTFLSECFMCVLQ